MWFIDDEGKLMILYLWYFIVQSLYYGFLTISRTLPFSLLMLVAIYGGFIHILRWSVIQFLFEGNPFTSVWTTLALTLFTVGLITISLLWFYRFSHLSEKTNLSDAIILGVALGMGYDMVGRLGSNMENLQWGFWPPGSLLYLQSNVYQGTWFEMVLWPGVASFGGLLALAFKLLNDFKKIKKLPCWIVLAVVATLICLEVLFSELTLHGQLGEFNGFVGFVTSWFYMLTASGRLSSTFLFVAIVSVLYYEQIQCRRMIQNHAWINLSQENKVASLFSEFSMFVQLLPKGFSGIGLWSEFVGLRHRFAYVTARYQRELKSGGPQVSLFHSQVEEVLEDLIPARDSLQRQLNGETVLAVSPEHRKNLTVQFISGLLITVISTLIFMVTIGWLGGLFTQKMGPMGYFYATGVMSAVAYVLSFFRKKLLTVLQNMAQVIQNSLLKNK